MHHTTSDISLAVASLYDSTEKAMDHSDVFFDLPQGSITNIQWIGENESDLLPTESPTSAPTPLLTEEVTNQSQEKRSFLAYALSIPILLVLASLLFLGKKKVKRKLVTKNEFASAMYDDVLIGTGDHPNRDLETISEESVETADHSTYRKKHFVNASSTDLGTKHSSIDVHQCTSARCQICMYKPQNVEFSNCQPCTDVEYVARIAEKQEDGIKFYKEQPLRSGESEV